MFLFDFESLKGMNCTEELGQLPRGMLTILYTKEENLNYFNKAIKTLLCEAKQTNNQKGSLTKESYRPKGLENRNVEVLGEGIN